MINKGEQGYSASENQLHFSWFPWDVGVHISLLSPENLAVLLLQGLEFKKSIILLFLGRMTNSN